jgi:hypothetical protein
MIQYRAEREETNIIISKVQSLQEKDQQWLAACRTKIDLSRKKNSNEDSNFRVDTAQGEAQPTKIFNKSVRKILDLAKQQNFAPSRRGKKSSVSAKETRINAARPPQESRKQAQARRKFAGKCCKRNRDLWIRKAHLLALIVLHLAGDRISHRISSREGKKSPRREKLGQAPPNLNT